MRSVDWNVCTLLMYCLQDEYSRIVKRKTGEKSSSEEGDEKLVTAFKNSFGKLKKNSRTSTACPNRAGLS